MKRFLVGILILAITSNAFASKRGTLPFSSFHLESEGISSSGKIVVEGRQNEKGQMLALNLQAFGKEFAVPTDQLSRLAGLNANGMNLSFEHGWGGTRTVYIQFQMGLASDVRKVAMVTLCEDGTITVSEVLSKENPVHP